MTYARRESCMLMPLVHRLGGDALAGITVACLLVPQCELVYFKIYFV
jgi:MFS superfamily sulfate permease-like transporter